MKCTFCGNNVPDGSELCPECGMILSLDGAGDGDAAVPAYMPNVFGSEPIKAPELPDGAEESAFGAEFSAPEYNPDSITTDTYEEAEPSYEEIPLEEVVEVPAEQEPACAPPSEELAFEDTDVEPEYDAQEDVPQEVYEAPEYESALSDEDEEPTVIYEAPAYGDEEVDASYSAVAQNEDVYVQSDEDVSEYESFADAQTEQEASEEYFAAYEEDDDSEKITPVIVPVEDLTAEKPEVQQTEDYDNAEDDDDTYVKSGKKGHAGAVAALCLLLVLLVVAGGYIVKKVLPSDGTTTTEPSAHVIATGTDATTVPSTSAQDATSAQQTTDVSDTTETDATTEPTTEPTTEVTEPITEPTTESTTEPSTSQPTTKPTTTKPTTTKPTTTKPSTTKPSTTKPTTKPSTTVDPYGINDKAQIKKPSSYLAESYIGYTNRKVDMLGGPSSSSDWVQSLGKGGEVKVLAQQSGYSYVFSTRFGTYGWIKSSYISDSRPVESTTSVSSDTVKPDKTADGKLMCTTYSLNMRTGPDKSYASIKIIPVNYQVKIIGYKTGVSGWAYVTDLVSGKNGWVSTAYLTEAE